MWRQVWNLHGHYCFPCSSIIWYFFVAESYTRLTCDEKFLHMTQIRLKRTEPRLEMKVRAIYNDSSNRK